MKLSKPVATMVLRNVSDLTPRARRDMLTWMKRQMKYVRDGHCDKVKLAPRYTARLYA